WETEGASVDEMDLISRREDWSSELPQHTDLPDGVAVLTMGVDVQADRIEYEVVGWGRGEESWSIRYGRIYGDVKQDPAVLEELDRLLGRAWTHAKGFPLWIRGACIDSGYATQAVYHYCKPRLRRALPNGLPQFVFAIKGRSQAGRTVWPEASTSTRGLKSRINLWTLGVDAAKEQIYSRLGILKPGPGYCHFPADRPLRYFEQLTAEQMVARYRAGRRAVVWELKVAGRPNEALDCRVYAYAAITGLRAEPFLLDLDAEVERVESVQTVVLQARPEVGAAPAIHARPKGRCRAARSKGFEV
ncbi:MAG: terminase gpA endonuclease subunit, partial [Dehalococcoidia bacterium]